MITRNLIIITGMSGAGKSSALSFLEDLGLFCVDNVPQTVFMELVEMLRDSKIDSLAIVMDVRSISKFGQIGKLIDKLRNMKDINTKLIFLDADDDVLVYRYRKTRRAHPLQKQYPLEEAIKVERGMLSELMKLSDVVINTSNMEIQEMRNRILQVLEKINSELPPIRVIVESFSFGAGIPLDANLVFDVRFLPNPYYIKELSGLTGLDKEIEEFIESFESFSKYFENLLGVCKITIEQFLRTGRNQLKIAVGCTGGRHRSVYVAQKLYQALKEDKKLKLKLNHRELLI
ncbi:RNase adapter RapZ [Kosmotoga sp. DU53]|uniref:RNase adapter RapZ n=1 Tax=Kosmotoga sp. DU53 TaxID=1310160 RepID=UPI0007D7FAF4|nr:RNase adapter RapZ [Kosmotoga sp. DU53]OAA19152.1 kinase [Kosmotoga sp. DU53]